MTRLKSIAGTPVFLPSYRSIARGPALGCVAAVLLSAFVGCVANIDEQSRARVGPESAALSEKARRDKPVEAMPGQSIDLASLRLEELSVREEAGQTTIELKLPKPITQYRHFPMTVPSRIVLDIFGESQQVTPAEIFRVGTSLVPTIRVSGGEGYLRVSLDIASASVPPYVVTPEAGGLKLVVGQVDPNSTTKRQLQLVKGGKRTDVQVSAIKSAFGESRVSPQSSESAKGEGKKYTGQLVSLDFKDADIKDVFRVLAQVSGLNIVVTNDVNKKVTVRLVDVPWDQAMDLLIDTNGLGKEQVGNVVRVSTAGQLKAERDALAAAKKAEEGLEPLHTAYFNINYAKVKELEPKLKTLLSKRPEASIVIDERSNTIMVRDLYKIVDDITTLVSKLDTRTPQILIESNLIETTPSFARALGAEIDFVSGRVLASSRFLAGAPFSGSANTVKPPFPVPNTGIRFGYVPFNVNAFITAAENQGNVKVISRPSVLTLNNVQSVIRSERILRIALPTSTNIASGTGASAGAAVATERIPIGIILSVTPQVSSDGFVLLNISVKSSSIANSPTVGNGTAGVIPFDELNREAVANVLVKDGETIVIGGILKDTNSSAETGVPYLKDVPVFGWLFKNMRWQKDFEELMVFITPRIASAGSENLPVAEQLWREHMNKTFGAGSPAPVVNP